MSFDTIRREDGPHWRDATDASFPFDIESENNSKKFIWSPNFWASHRVTTSRPYPMSTIYLVKVFSFLVAGISREGEAVGHFQPVVDDQPEENTLNG